MDRQQNVRTSLIRKVRHFTLRIVLNARFSVQVKVLIPAGAVGALIGKGGEAMRSLKNESGCRVQMSKNQEMFQSELTS